MTMTPSLTKKANGNTTSHKMTQNSQTPSKEKRMDEVAASKKSSSFQIAKTVDDSDDSDDTSENGSHADDASSLSSIPLLELKKRMQQEKEQAKKKIKSTAKSKVEVEVEVKAKVIPIKPKRKSDNPATKGGASKTAFSAATKQQPKIKQQLKMKQQPKLSPISDQKKVVTKDQATKNPVAGTTASKNATKSDSDGDSEEEEAACCLCHCGVDCSDRALFFPKDRKHELQEEGDYYFQLDDPYLPEPLYDRSNALVYCDSCNRLYHQKCHFVPLLVIPRGDWDCMVCSLQRGQVSRRSPKKASKTSTKHAHAKSNEPQPWKKYCERTIANQLFTSPPTMSAKTLEQEWELATAFPKAQLWHLQLKQLQTFLKSQASNIRMATAALETLTGTKRNRAHFTTKGRKSQELAQTLVRLSMGKWKIRTALQSLERLRLWSNELLPQPQKLIDWTQKEVDGSHISHIFPHGIELYQTQRRIIPRTRELGDPADPEPISPSPSKTVPAIPMEISVRSPQTKKRTKSPLKNGASGVPSSPRAVLDHATKKRTTDATESKAKDKKTDDDDDSGISLDDLQCCVCLVGDSTDENDVLLCDGQGCCRAFHMKCVHPVIQLQDIENEDEDWFCPLCSAISNLTADVQLACMDEDWEHRRATTPYRQLGEASSLYSWANAEDVFPEAEWEYPTSLKLKAGKQNEATARLLHHYLGDDVLGNNQQIAMPLGSDSEDENDYSLFDEKSFDERRHKERLEDDKGDGENDGNNSSDDHVSQSTRSSQASLQDMSSIELNIGKSELAALSDEDAGSSSDQSSNDGSDGNGNRERRSRRLRNLTGKSEQSSFADVGADFDEGNILEGKRRRKAVDYRKLNDALFGELTAKERAQIDDKDDFQLKGKKKPSRPKKRKGKPKPSDDEKEGTRTRPSKRSKCRDIEEAVKGKEGVSVEDDSSGMEKNENMSEADGDNDSSDEGGEDSEGGGSDSDGLDDSNSNSESGSDDDNLAD